MSSLITHRGVISEIDGDVAVLEVKRDAACSGCEQKGSCGMGSDDFMYLKLKNMGYGKGDILEVEIGRKDFFRSILLVYILPVVVMVFAAVLVDQIAGKDIVTAVATLVSLVPYFIWLKFYMKGKGSNITVRHRISADRAANLNPYTCSR